MAWKMKDSGVAWIDKIPIGWEIKNIRALFSFGKGLPITKDNLCDSGTSVISYGQIHSKKNPGTRLEATLFRYVGREYLSSHPSSLVHSGDFIFADTSEDLEGCGNCAYVDTDMTLFAGYHTIILRAKEGTDNRYFAYLFKSDEWRRQIRERVTGVKLFSVSQKILKNLSVIVPPKNLQSAIANYLDLKCAEIDTVLDKTRTSIEEYKKLKQAIITQAVTKGIRGDSPTRESGVDWIGSIPKEWACKKVKHVATISRGLFNHRPRNDERYYTGSYPFIQTGDVANASKYITTYSQTLNELGKNVSKEFPKGTLTMTIAANVGDVAILGFDAFFPDSVVGFVPHKGISELYLFYIFKAMKEEFVRTAIKSTQLNLNIERVGDLFIPVTMDSKEQQEIVQYLEDKWSAIDRLIAKKEQVANNLEQYKKSLIYEYVTGKKEVPQDEH